MEQEYLIDSNILIGYLDNRLPEKGMAFMNQVINSIPNISVITKIEILRYQTSVYNDQILKDFIDSSVVYPLDNPTVDQTIQLCKLKKIKLPDAIIASTAIINHQVLITRNVSDFKSISSLKLLNPYDDDFEN